jgi:hypothetical protein
MNFIEKNKQNLLYVICILTILSIFLPYYSITSVGSVSTTLGDSSSSLSLNVKGMSLDSIFIVPFVSLLTMFFVYKDSKFTILGFTILSLISIAYMTHLIGLSEVSGSSSVNSSVGDFNFSASSSVKATPSVSYGLFLFFLLSMIGLYIRYILYSVGNAYIKVIKTFYILSIIISVLSFLIILLILFSDDAPIWLGVFLLDIILLCPIMRLVLQKNRLQLIDNKDESIVDQIDKKNKTIKQLLIIFITIMVIIITWISLDESLKW